jgi:hypothetical protein
MPSYSAPVGGLTLPLAAGSAQQRIADPIVDALLDFLAWSLGNDLSARLANLTGTSAVAVPTTNRFAYDPTSPRGHSVRVPVPALFCWWDGQSQAVDHTTVRRKRTRVVRALYVFDELPHTDQLVVREGLFAAVDASFTKAAHYGHHSSYAYGSAATGTPLVSSVGDPGSWAWRYVGGQGVQRFQIDEASTANVGRRAAGRDWPAFAASFAVEELVAQPTLVDPTDVWPQATVDVRATDLDPGEGYVDIMTGHLPAEPQE